MEIKHNYKTEKDLFDFPNQTQYLLDCEKIRKEKKREKSTKNGLMFH